jgi:hypothetical protein
MRAEARRDRTLLLVSLVAVLSGAPTLAQNEEPSTWVERTPPSDPLAARHGHAMAYDAARGRVVLFGGAFGSTGFLADTWEWDGSSWIERTPATSPPARGFHAMVYDSARARVVLFGGRGPAGNPAGNLADTWEWDGSAWLRRTPGNSPHARSFHAMAYDSARARVVLFGGGGPSSYSGDTWEWDGSTWIERTTATRPESRRGHAMAYDSARGRVVLFGGGNPTTPLADTWEWDGNSWTTPAASYPPPRTYHAMAYDSARGRVVMFGGAGGSDPLGDTWEWDGTYWVERSQAKSPLVRQFHSMAYDAARGRTVLFGGSTEISSLGDTWEWDGSSWVGRTPSPPARVRHAMTGTGAHGRVLVFGGSIGSVRLSDTWEWDDGVWIERASVSEPPQRSLHAMAYDSARGRVVLFGGQGASGSDLADTWEWDGSTWIDRSPLLAPSPRYLHGMAYDSTRGRVVLFGGFGPSGFLGDTWEWDGSHWTERTSASSPPPRYDHAMAYDSVRDRVVLFGGAFGLSLADTWEWDGSSWVERFGDPSPPARAGHTMVYDSARERVVLFGGREPGFQGLGLGDTWEWNGTEWSARPGASGPAARYAHAMAYDSARGLVVLFGGTASSVSGYLADTWEYPGCAGIELCNGLDDGNDGCLPRAEIDLDGDGYVACSPWSGADPGVLAGADCAPFDAATHPDAAELCDGFDNDCNDVVPLEEADDDSDVVPTCGDNCPAVFNPSQHDDDGDLHGDACDNCPSLANDDQADGDGELTWQWASAATASSEYSSGDYSAMQAAGSPENAGVCQERPTNGSPLGSTADPEWLELTYSVPLGAIGVDVHESFEQGFVKQIELREPSGVYHMVWAAADSTTCGDVLEARFGLTGYTVDRVRVRTAVAGWEEIDAVALVGLFDAAEGVGNACDNCPEHANPSQADFDVDGAGDACDCAVTNSAARPAAEVEGLVIESPGAGVLRLSWQPAAGASSYEIVRGALSSLSVTHMGECHASGIAALDWEDAEVPAAGQAFIYLVRGQSTACGPGTLGFGIYGLARAQTGSACQ